MAFFIGSLGSEDTRRNCLVLIGLPKPIYTSDFFLCSISHLNEHFRWSHSLYLKLQFVFPSARWRTLTAAAASYQSHINSPHLLSPVFGPCFRLYGSLLFSEGSDLSLPSLPLTYDLKFLFPSFLSDSKGPFLPGLWGGWVAVENWLVSFTSFGGGPPSAFFFFFSVFIRRPQVCRSELNEIPESKVSWCYPQTLTRSRLNQDSGASLPLWMFPIAFTVSQDKSIFTNNSNCSSLVPCFGISFSTPSPSHLSNHLGFCDYFALTSGGWTLWT